MMRLSGNRERFVSEVDVNVMQVLPEDVLGFWFGGPVEDAMFVTARIGVWFKTDVAFDALVRERFVHVLERATAGKLDHWADGARSALALVIVLDQFPRNIHRGEPAAFATDERARALSRQAIERGFEAELSLIERVFLSMPFEHAEDLALQDFCVRGYLRLHDEAPPAFKALMRQCIEAGEEHREVIRQFGRFPHRNAILGRASTPEELAWVDGHHGWGQGPAILKRNPGTPDRRPDSGTRKQ